MAVVDPGVDDEGGDCCEGETVGDGEGCGDEEG